MYKYSCRKCPIRNRCINESNNDPEVTKQIREAFEMQTDTLQTWGLLQPNCLLIKAEKEWTKQGPYQTRFRQGKKAQPQRKKNPSQTRPSQSRSKTKAKKVSRHPTFQPLSSRSTSRHKETQSQQARWLTISKSGRRIGLPETGELVLGRFDPNFGIPPDVDLSYEDQETEMISRRHAKIIGNKGKHTLTDLGSHQGIYLNGHRIRFTEIHPLHPGDRIALGTIHLNYEFIPPHISEPPQISSHFLIVTPTWRRLSLSPSDELIIGRTDSYLSSNPDIDLMDEGEAAQKVSRRHAMITWQEQRPHLEDLGSSFGTRLNGETLAVGDAIPLKPGDHIWLGGCVLAYDIEL